MIHAICDFCGKDTDRTANLISITPFQNFARYHTDKEPYGNTDKTRSFVICSKCLGEHCLPNPFHEYKKISEQELHYKKCLDNYSEEDFKEECRERGGKHE